MIININLNIHNNIKIG